MYMYIYIYMYIHVGNCQLHPEDVQNYIYPFPSMIRRSKLWRVEFSREATFFFGGAVKWNMTLGKL